MLDSDILEKIAAGRSVPPGAVSIVLPHYETPELARLCLRAIRRFTARPFEVLVIDNASGDGRSLEVLRAIEWIRLVERPADSVPPQAALAHASALNIGLEHARGELLLAMHTDTIPLRSGWLGALAGPFDRDERLGVLGSDKLDAPGPVHAALKALGDGKTYRRLARRLAGRPLPERLRPRPPHARSYCALYRRAALEEAGLDFMAHKWQTAGEDAFHGMVEAGWGARLLPPREMRRWVEHVVHATALLSQGREIHTGRVRRRTVRRMRRLLESDWVRDLMSDDSLDTL